MPVDLTADLERLRQLAYHRFETAGDLVRRYHALSAQQRAHPLTPALIRVYAWLFVPFTLWPIDMEGLFDALLTQVESGRKTAKAFDGLLGLIPAVPAVNTQAVTAAHEHAVEAGDYAPMIRAHCKYEETERKLAKDPEFLRQWAHIKTHFAVEQYQDAKGIIRRTLVSERSMRANWAFSARTAADRFQAAFDLFCFRWHLYGMKGDSPLLQTLTVNLTPYGTMIFIPAYWSFDPKRDLDWKAITALHRSRGVRKQGEKLGSNQRERDRQARKALRLWEALGKQGVRGEARMTRIKQALGLDPRTDDSTLRRLIRDARACS